MSPTMNKVARATNRWSSNAMAAAAVLVAATTGLGCAGLGGGPLHLQFGTSSPAQQAQQPPPAQAGQPTIIVIPGFGGPGGWYAGAPSSVPGAGGAGPGAGSGQGAGGTQPPASPNTSVAWPSAQAPAHNGTATPNQQQPNGCDGVPATPAAPICDVNVQGVDVCRMICEMAGAWKPAFCSQPPSST